MAKKVLGKGLGAIISGSLTPVDDMENVIVEARDRIIELDVNQIQPNPDQPRTHFDEEDINSLAESIRTSGLLQPIIVRREGPSYFVIAGERRLRAAKRAGLGKIKSIIMHATEEDNLSLALIENVQRTNLNPIEEAKAYRTLIHRFKLKQQDIAQRVGKDRTTIANLIRLLGLPEQIQRAIAEGRISTGHGKVLLSMPPDRQNLLYNEILKKDISVRALELLSQDERFASAKKKGAPDKRIRHKEAHLRKMEEMLVSRLGTKVEIKHSGGKGRIEIHYYSLDDFDRIVELLK